MKVPCTNCGQFLAEQCVDCDNGPYVSMDLAKGTDATVICEVDDVFTPIPKWVVSDALYRVYKHKLSIGEDVSDKPEVVSG